MRWLYGCDKELLAAEVVKLRISRQLDGITAVGTSLPKGSAEYFSSALGECAATVPTLGETAVQL